MTRLIALRVVMSVMSLFLAAAFTFSLVHLSPTDPVVLALGDGATAERKLELTKELGLDRPVVIQFGSWVAKGLSGDFGESIFAHRPVSRMVVDALPVTMSLVTGAVALAILFGLFAGTYGGLHSGSWADRSVTSAVSVALAIPSFWLALLLGLWLGVKLRLFPIAGYTPFTVDAGRWTLGLALPCLALSIHGAAVIARHMRGAVIDVLESNYINAVRARGTSRRLIVWRYVLKNALVPVMPVIGIEVAVLLATSPVIEKVFVLPGMGTLMVNAVITSDFPLLQGTILTIATILITVNFLVDVGLGMLDPRIRSP